MSPNNLDLEDCYDLLGLNPKATLQDIDAAYLHWSAHNLKKGDRQAVAALKLARRTLMAHLQRQVEQAEPTAGATNAQPAQLLTFLLEQQGIHAQVSIRDRRLHIGLQAAQIDKPKATTAKIYTFLETLSPITLDLSEVETVKIYGLRAAKQAAWTETFAMPKFAEHKADEDLLSFKNRFSNIFILPIVLFLAILCHLLPLVGRLLWGIQIWIHEFGHATIAWLSGRRAIPLPIGWTNVDYNRSLFVYVGVLVLLGLLFWAGWREKCRWPMVLAIVFAVIQFCMTWLMSEDTFIALLAFGGIGGEFYLSTLILISFYFPMPNYLQWEFWRYPTAFCAAFTLWAQIWLWHRIKVGWEDIPMGSLWGGENSGDMNVLIDDYGWSEQQVINTYSTLSGFCITALLAVYLYVLFVQNRSLLFSLWQQFLARQSS